MKLFHIQIRLLFRWLRYFWRAKTIYDVHSPFVADFVNVVLEDDRTFYAFSEIEFLREKLLKNKTELIIEDHGAGSKVNPSTKRLIADVAHHSAVPPEVGQLLFRLVHFSKPKTILELGTSLGISTLYLASGALNAQVRTLEGCPDIADKALHHFSVLNRTNIQLYKGKFEETLPKALADWRQLDFLFLDGDHRQGASWHYFEKCLEHAHEYSVFVIADIHWSAEMEQAWTRMQAHSRVKLSIDLFYVGILFFRIEQHQIEHYTLIKKSWKPWRLGIFGA